MNEEFEFEAFGEQPFFFETEGEAETARRGARPSRASASRRPYSTPRKPPAPRLPAGAIVRPPVPPRAPARPGAIAPRPAPSYRPPVRPRTIPRPPIPPGRPPIRPRPRPGMGSSLSYPIPQATQPLVWPDFEPVAEPGPSPVSPWDQSNIAPRTDCCPCGASPQPDSGAGYDTAAGADADAGYDAAGDPSAGNAAAGFDSGASGDSAAGADGAAGGDSDGQTASADDALEFNPEFGEWLGEFGYEMPGYEYEAPPVEGRYGGITGATCLSGRGKCWRGPKSRDIIDADVPWNDKDNRSTANYEAVLDYFNVGDSPNVVNPRYRRVPGGPTYCNIYVHDVTRAMWASIPHWVQARNRWHELNANATFDWLLRAGRSHGWIPIDGPLCSWIHQQHQTRAIAPPPDPSITNALQAAAGRIVSGQHANPGLLLQPSYIAQWFGNLGLPTVAVLKNAGGIGHVAMIRPERGSLVGMLRESDGKFIPRTAQAGGKNWTNKLMLNMAAAMVRGKVLFFVHE